MERQEDEKKEPVMEEKVQGENEVEGGGVGR